MKAVVVSAASLFCLGTTVFFLTAPIADTAHAQRCGGINQRACPRLMPGPQCDMGLRAIDGHCRGSRWVRPRPERPGNGSSRRDESADKRFQQIVESSRGQIDILKKFGSCMARQKSALRNAVIGEKTGRADEIKNRCLSNSDQRRLRTVSNSEDNGRLRHRSLSVGLSADVSFGFGAGAEVGFVWDLDGNLPTRVYASGAAGGGARAGAGGDLNIAISIDPNTSGLSQYSAFSVSVDAGVGLGFALVTTRSRGITPGQYRGLEHSVGVGIGANLGSHDKIRTRIFRRSCRNVEVKVTNTGNKNVRILDLNYYDYDSRKWRSEPTPNRTVKPGETLGVWKRPHDLGKVGYERTQLEVVYRYRGNKHTKKLPAGTCRDGQVYRVDL